MNWMNKRETTNRGRAILRSVGLKLDFYDSCMCVAWFSMLCRGQKVDFDDGCMVFKALQKSKA